VSYVHVLERAAALIEEHGWVQFSFGDETKGYCITGAIMRASRDDARMSQVLAYDMVAEQLKLDEVALPGVLPQFGGPGSWLALSYWNDSPGRTEQEVLRVLRRAAS
jgi:hypothetical protein